MKKSLSFLRTALEAIVEGRSRQAQRLVNDYRRSRGLPETRDDD